MSMYNLLEYSDNFSVTSGSLWNYYRDQVSNYANEFYDNNNIINNNKTTTSTFFKYKTRTIKNTSNNNSRLNAEVVVPLKYLINFWRSLDLLLINSEMELDLTWSKFCVISEVSRTFREADPNADPVVYEMAKATTGATFE